MHGRKEVVRKFSQRPVDELVAIKIEGCNRAAELEADAALESTGITAIRSDGTGRWNG